MEGLCDPGSLDADFAVEEGREKEKTTVGLSVVAKEDDDEDDDDDEDEDDESREERSCGSDEERK